MSEVVCANLRPSNPYTLPTIDFVGGSTQDLAFRVYFYLNGNPFDLSSCTADFSVINYVNKKGTPLISKAMSIAEGDCKDGERVSNTLCVTLDPEDTVDLVGKFIYQITIRDISGDVEMPDHGILQITNNINKVYVK